MRLFGTHLAVLGLLSAAHPAMSMPVTQQTTTNSGSGSGSGSGATGEVAGRASSSGSAGPPHIARWKTGAAAALAVGTIGLAIGAEPGRQESGGAARPKRTPPTGSYDEPHPLDGRELDFINDHLEKMKGRLADGMTHWDDDDRESAQGLWFVCMSERAKAEFQTTFDGSLNIVQMFLAKTPFPAHDEIDRRSKSPETKARRVAELAELEKLSAEIEARYEKARAAPEDNPMAFSLHQVQNAVQHNAIVAAVDRKAGQLQHLARKAVLPAMRSVRWSQLERSATKNAVALEAKLKYAGE
ncbi:MAG: hypothetical protein M1826_007140 [Phylliscum demangeonii]|nr:MAG: hypothetical protein M1826_007140 [Phylliscum demangeonii]